MATETITQMFGVSRTGFIGFVHKILVTLAVAVIFMLLGLSLQSVFDNNITNAANTSAEFPGKMDEDTFGKLLILEKVEMYMIPFLIAIGVIGNVFSVLILLQHNLKKRPTAHFLAAKCLSDTLFLLCLLLLWIHTLGFSIYGSGIWCHLISMVTQATNFQSIWLMQCMVLDRYFVICVPRWANTHCCHVRSEGDKPVRQSVHSNGTSVIWARTAIIIIAFVAIAVYLNLSLTVGVVLVNGKDSCLPLFQFVPALKILGYIDLLMNVIVPYVGMTFLMSSVLLYVHRFHVSRKQVINHAGNQKKKYYYFYPKPELRQTKIILIVCIFYILSTGPTQMFRLYRTSTDLLHIGLTGLLDTFLLPQVFQLLYFSAFAFNFPLLLLIDRIYRKVLKLLIMSFITRLRDTCRHKRHTFPSHAMTFALEFSSTLVRLNETALL